MVMRGFSRYGAGMLILIDGYNVIAPAAPPGRSRKAAERAAGSPRQREDDWLQHERMRLLRRLARQLDPALAAQTLVVFDASGPVHRRPDSLHVGGIAVRFAVDHDQADDLIEELIAAHHTPKRLTVVSSDHRLQVAAARAGATAFDAQPWLDALLEGRLMLAIRWPPPDRRGQRSQGDPDSRGGQPVEDAQRVKQAAVDRSEVERWMRLFGFSAAGEVPAEQQRPSHELPAAAESPGEPLPHRNRQELSAQAQRPSGAADRPTAERGGLVRQGGNEPAEQGRGEQGRGATRRAETPPDRPRRELPRERDNPFPDGYGEDLL